MAEDPFKKALKAWHGSPAQFSGFDDQHIGSGEGSLEAWGHHISEDRDHALKYSSLRPGSPGFLYEVEAQVDPDKMIPLHTPFGDLEEHHQELIERALGTRPRSKDTLFDIQGHVGAAELSQALHEAGAHGFSSDDGTHVIIDPTRLRIVSKTKVQHG